MRTSLTFFSYMAVSSLSVSLFLLYTGMYIFVNRSEFGVMINFVFAADFARFSVAGVAFSAIYVIMYLNHFCF